MATFTMELRDVITATEGHIGLDDYPIWNESYRDELNAKIIRHYYTREIAHESIEMFTLRMKAKMEQIMPYYNQLYKSVEIKFDPLSTADFTTTTNDSSSAKNTSKSSGTSEDTGTSKRNANTENDGTSEGSSTSGNTSRTVGSETPQSALSGDEDYATTAADSYASANAANTGKTHDEGTSSETGSSTATGKSSATGEGETEAEGRSETRLTGYQGSASALLAAYRANILNIDPMIIQELVNLFMNPFMTGDEYYNGRSIL